MANEAMEAAWNGEEGAQWAEDAERYAKATVRIDAGYQRAIPLRGSDSVLDVGCGAGGVALDLAERATFVFGIDLSSQMLDVAAKRAAEHGITNIEFVRADAQTYAFESGRFDLATSGMGVMFFDDPVAAFTNISRALRPDGTVCFAAWRALHDNEWLMAIRAALALGRDLPVPPLAAPTPFSLSDPDRTRSLLSAAGFADIELAPLDEPITPGDDVDEAFAFVSRMGIVKGLTESLDDDDKTTAFENLRRMLADHQTPGGVQFGTAAWVITARKDS